MDSIRTVSTADNVAAQEYMQLRRSFGEGVILNGGALTSAVWHLGNLIKQATDGRYTLVLKDGDAEVPATDLQWQADIEPIRILEA